MGVERKAVANTAERLDALLQWVDVYRLFQEWGASNADICAGQGGAEDEEGLIDSGEALATGFGGRGSAGCVEKCLDN